MVTLGIIPTATVLCPSARPHLTRRRRHPKLAALATNKRANWVSRPIIDPIRNKRWTEQDARWAAQMCRVLVGIPRFLVTTDMDPCLGPANRSPRASRFVPVVVRPEHDEDHVALVVRLGAQLSLEIRVPERVSTAWVAALLRELGEGVVMILLRGQLGSRRP